jgi:hypothetical protein
VVCKLPLVSFHGGAAATGGEPRCRWPQVQPVAPPCMVVRIKLKSSEVQIKPPSPQNKESVELQIAKADFSSQ